MPVLTNYRGIYDSEFGENSVQQMPFCVLLMCVCVCVLCVWCDILDLMTDILMSNLTVRFFADSRQYYLSHDLGHFLIFKQWHTIVSISWSMTFALWQWRGYCRNNFVSSNFWPRNDSDIAYKRLEGILRNHRHLNIISVWTAFFILLLSEQVCRPGL